MKLSNRLSVLEVGVVNTTEREVVETFSEALKAFLDDVFPSDPVGCRMDHVARCCGLPHAKAMRQVFEADTSPEAFRAAAERTFGKDWLDCMQETMDAALGQIAEVRGTDGPIDFASVFPPVLNASAVVIEGMNR